MVQKLSHIKMIKSIHGQSRSLLVTQQVGASDRLISLADLLLMPSERAFQAIPQVVLDITDQLASLGSTTENQRPVSDVLWPHHDIATIQKAWSSNDGNTEARPVHLMQHLKGLRELAWITQQQCIHGDLNITNVAIEVIGDSFKAYIFDAEGIRPDNAARDLAMLEVTSLLHQTTSKGDSLISACKDLYKSGTLIPDPPTGQDIGPEAQNVFHFIREVRRSAQKRNDCKTYALTVFDSVMLQLGGLALQSRGNKIVNARDALTLAEFATTWLLSLAPEFGYSPMES